MSIRFLRVQFFILYQTNHMNRSYQQTLLQSIKSFLIAGQQLFQQSVLEFQTKLQQLLIRQMFQSQQQNLPQKKLQRQAPLHRKTVLSSLEIKPFLIELMKLQNNLKYYFAILVVLILCKSKQKQNSLLLGFYYEILNSLVKQLKNDEQSIKKIPNNSSTAIDKQKKVKIHKYITSKVLSFIEDLIHLNLIDKNHDFKSSILENMHYLSQYFAKPQISQKKSSQNAFKFSKMIKIVASIMCLPQKSLPLDLLLLTLLKFQNNVPNFQQILVKIQYKLVIKLQKYQNHTFTEVDIANLLKILLYRVETQSTSMIINKLFQPQIKENSIKKQKCLNQDQCKVQLSCDKKQILTNLIKHLQQNFSLAKTLNQLNCSFGYHLICFIVKNLSTNKSLFPLHQTNLPSLFLKQVVFFLSVNYFYNLPSFNSEKQTIKFYNTIVASLINENNIFILKMCLNFIQNQSIAKFSVHKLKSLFKLLTEISKKLQKMQNLESKSNKGITASTQNEDKQGSHKKLISENKNNDKNQKQGSEYYQILINEQVELAKLKISRVIRIFEELTQKYRDKSTELVFQNSKSSRLNLQKIKDSNSLVLNLKLHDMRNFDVLFEKQKGQSSTSISKQNQYQKITGQGSDFFRMISFVVGKTQKYEVFFKICPSAVQYTSTEKSTLNKKKGADTLVFLDDFLNSQTSYTAQILVCRDQKIVFQDQIKNIQKVACAYLEFNLLISCNRSKQSNGSTLFIKINEKIIQITTKLKRNEITSLQLCLQYESQRNSKLVHSMIKNLYLFGQQIPQNLIYKAQYSNSIQSSSYLVQSMGIQAVTCRINQSSEEILQDLKKDQAFFFKKQLKYKAQNVTKRRAIQFIQVFRQIGGLNSVFYILQKINKSYANHFGEKTQNFFIEIFKILKTIASYDRGNFLFYEVKKSYSYICHFLFLIFKRNQHLAHQRNSHFVESLFKFMMFFSSYFTKELSVKKYPAEEVYELQLIFVKQVLCNFQIWSQCSLQIQSFVFLTLESFIKNEKYTFALFSIDLHAKILSSVTFFYSQQFNPLKNKFQQKILMLCQQLYDKMVQVFDPKTNQLSSSLQFLPFLINSLSKDKIGSMNKQKSKDKQKNDVKHITKKQLTIFLDKYVHRDVNQSLSLIYSLILYHGKNSSVNQRQNNENLNKSKVQLNKSRLKSSVASLNLPCNINSAFSNSIVLPSQLKTCWNLSSYFVKNFVQKQAIFHKIGDDWGYVLLILSSLQESLLETKHKQSLNFDKRATLSGQIYVLIKLMQVIFKIVAKNHSFFNYIITSLQKVIMSGKICFMQAFCICSQIIHLNKKFNFQIFDTVFFLLDKKINSCQYPQQQIHRFFNHAQLQKHLYKMVDVGLTHSKEFEEFLARMYKQVQSVGFREPKNQKDPKDAKQLVQNRQVIIQEFFQKQAVPQNVCNQNTSNQAQQVSKDSIIDQFVTEEDQTNKQLIRQQSNDRNARPKQDIFTILLQLENILFEVCYQTGQISSGNRQWIESYFRKKYQNKIKQKEIFNYPANILKGRRNNPDSNLRIGHFCSSRQTVYFMVDLLDKLGREQSHYGSLQLNQQTGQNLMDSAKKRPQKSKIQQQSFKSSTQQQINGTVNALINQVQPISFFLANPKLSISSLYCFYQAVLDLQNAKINYLSCNGQSTTKTNYSGSSISLMTFVQSFLMSKSLKYLLERYSYSEEGVSIIEKPVQALKRKQQTLKALEMFSLFFKRQQFDGQGFYICLLTEIQVNLSNTQNTILAQNNYQFQDKESKKTKEIQQKLKKFIQSWYINNNSLFRINPHDRDKIKSPKRLNFQQKQLFDLIYEKLKYICIQETKEQQKINELFAFMTEKTKGSQSRLFMNVVNRMITTLNYVLDTKNTITLLSNIQFFKQKIQFLGCPKNPYPVLSEKQVEEYRQTLVQKFNRILHSERKKCQKSQNQFKKIQKENQFWLQIDQKDHQKKNQIFQLDEKQIGPFGLYKLNIKPSIQRVEQIHYPRKKMFSSMKSSQTSADNQMEDNGEESILLTKTRIFDLKFTENEDLRQRRNTLLQSNLNKHVIKTIQKIQGSVNNHFLCQYVTKRGVYAGKLIVKSQCIEFRYLSHLRLPNQPIYELSTGRFHQINQLTDEQAKRLSCLRISYKKCKLFIRRYILRHTAIELFQKIDHHSYFFNLFHRSQRQKFLNLVRSSLEECIESPKEQFVRKQYTQQWKCGIISNFQYISLVNRYSGRSTNDLAQYYVFPWVIANYNGKNGFNQVNEDFLKNKNNLRNLAHPPGKFNEEKFIKLKTRLMQLDFCGPEERFLYGTMFSNPTVLYNFFIRMEPYIHLHWEHQGKRIDHADRLFSGIQEQFSSVLTASSDMKQLTPQFYYWPQFLKNRSYIDLGLKQNKLEVDDVVLPVWAQSPEQFIFRMRYVLQSYQVSEHLHEWIDLTFGYKIKYQNAQQNDNLYHFNSYQRLIDYFQEFAQDKREIKSLQVSISQFGQVPQALFDEPHTMKNLRHQFLIIDRFLNVKYEKNLNKTGATQHLKVGFETCKEGIFVWTSTSVEFKKSYITQNYSYDEQSKVYPSNGNYARLLSFEDQSWLTLNQGVLRIFLKKILKFQKSIEAQCLDIIGNYYIYSKNSSIYMDQYDSLNNQLVNKKILFGHKDQIIQIICSKSLDLILSVDLQGFVMLHEMSNLSFFNNFQLPLQKQWSRNQIASQNYRKMILKIQIHEMGYFVFLINQRKLVIVTFLGQIFLEHDLEIMSSESKGKRQEQKITQLIVFRHDQALLLLSTDKGNIYEIDFIEIKRYSQVYPYKTFTRIQNNVLDYLLSQNSAKKSMVRQTASQQSKNSDVRGALQRPIYSMRIQKIPGDKICLYQIIVQYEDGNIASFYEQKYLGKQLKQNEKLKQIGLFF